MMKFVKPAKLNGSIRAPASKSLAQRLLLLSSLLEGPSTIELDSLCEDTERCAGAIASLGAEVRYRGGFYEVTPAVREPSALIDCGESGTCFRMICSLCARFGQVIEISGSGSLSRRPMEMGVVPLEQLGANVRTTEGHLPLFVKGPFRTGRAEVDGSLSSQFLSGLLLALPFCEGEFVLQVNNLKSKPYIQLTLQVLKEAGLEIYYSPDFRYFQIAGNQKGRGKKFRVEGDWSSIATLLVAGAIGGELTVTNVKKDSVQADRAVLDVLESAKAKLEWNQENLTVSAPNGLTSFNFDAEDCPDVIPALVALAVNCDGRSEIKGAQRLTHKESDRAAALCSEYSKVGAKVVCEGNSMFVEGSIIQGGVVSSHADHRIAMSLAVAALKSKDGMNIEDSHVVAKSYPEFFEDLESVIVP